jgi:lipocalin-like protein
MDRRDMLGISVIAALALLPGGAIAQQKSIKDQLVGTWTLLVTDMVKADGTHVPYYGPNPTGSLIFTPDGHYSAGFARSNRAPFASNNPNITTADENKATVAGTYFHFGTYTVDERDKSFSFRVEGGSFPNWEGTRQKRPVTAITDEVLTFAILTPPAPGYVGTELVWKKAK